MAIDFKKIVLQNEVGTKNKVAQSDSVYAPNMLKSIINYSGDWMQKLKNTTTAQAIHGNVELASLNMNNNIPVVGSTKSATVDVKSGGIIQGQIAFSLIDAKTTEDSVAKAQVLDDLEALMYQSYYALDDMIYGSVPAYQTLGIYGLVSNPQVAHGATSLAQEYGNSTAAQIITDLQAYITGYYDDINNDTSIRPINPSALKSEIKIPSAIMKVLRLKAIESTDFAANYETVLEFMTKWVIRMGYQVTFSEDAGMDLVSPQGGKGATYKVMMIGVFTKTYISLEIPNAPQRAGLQGKSTDWGFDIKSERSSAAYTMQVLGTQIMRTNMFLTRDV